MRGSAWLLVVAVGVAACSSSGPGGGPAGWCAPGATQACLCAPGVQGIQTCRDDAGGWQPCQCGPGTGLFGDAADGSSAGDGAATSDSAAAADVPAPDTEADVPPDAALPDAADAPVADAGDAVDVPDWGNYFDDAAADGDPATDPDAVVQVGPDTTLGDCPARAKLIYVVTQENVLLSFDPAKLQLKPVGNLACPTPPGATPFSMAIDRKANAFVLYQTGFGGDSIYQVSTLDAGCKATGYVPNQKGIEVFGMGFSADVPKAKDETLWIAGSGAFAFSSGACTLGQIDLNTLQLQKVSGMPGTVGCPDLTGNDMAELYAFFPSTSPPSVRQIDKSTGGTLQTWPLPKSTFSGLAAAWAFAQWGGHLYLFFDNEKTPSTTVWRLEKASGNVVAVLTNIGYTVTGAGVSSCAPSN